MAKIVNKYLYSWDKSEADVKIDGSETTVDVVLRCIRKELSESGDRVIIREAVPNHSHNRQEISLSQLEPAMTKLAHGLQANGLQRGDVVQCYLYNNADFFIPIVASWMAGAVTSMCDPSLTPDVISQQLQATKPKIIFSSPPSVANIQKACQLASIEAKIIVVNATPDHSTDVPSLEEVSRDFPATDIPDEHRKHGLDDDAVIFWSSGTTGNPKGTVITQRNVLANMTSQIFTAYGTNSFLVQTTCMFHGGGFFFCMINAIRYGNTLITFSLQDSVEPDQLFRAVDQFKPSVLMLGAHHGVQLSLSDPEPGLDLTSVTRIVPIGSAVPTSIPEDLRKRFPNAAKVVNVYGATEVSGVSLVLNDFTSLGALVRGASAKVIDPETEEPLDHNQTGEICVQTPGRMKTYINVTEKEKQRAFTKDGYFRTGDLGYYGQDGTLYYYDRLKALIKYKGHHIIPAEIEALVREHPDVLEVGVFGIPDPTVMELITAAVVKRKDSQLTEQELEDWVNRRLNDYRKIRGGVHFIPRLPTSMQGKMLRRKLKEVIGTEEK